MIARTRSSLTISTELVEGAQSEEEMVPDFKQMQQRFTCGRSDASEADRAQAKAALLAAITERAQAPFYIRLCEQLHWEPDAALLSELRAKNAATQTELDAKVLDATENLGESEVREALLARATFLARIGDKDRAVAALDETETKTVALGQKLDLVFTQVRLGIFHGDALLTQRAIDRAAALLERGADWDRRNRLKVYKGVDAILRKRDLAEATKEFLDTLSTYSCYEMFDQREFVALTVAAALPALPRPELRTRLLDAAEFVAVSAQLGGLGDVAHAVYYCDYRTFFSALERSAATLRTSWLLAPHAAYICRELRVRVYTQLLESYRSVQLASMAAAFGVSVAFIDRELSRFIALGRLHCRIDKVGGIVDTTRPDSRNAQYQSTIRQGDALLNRLQKLARLVVV